MPTRKRPGSHVRKLPSGKKIRVNPGLKKLKKYKKKKKVKGTYNYFIMKR